MLNSMRKMIASPPSVSSFDPRRYGWSPRAGGSVPDNLLLKALPADVRARMSADLSPTSLRRDQAGAKHVVTGSVFFPTDCVVSLITELESGGSVESAMVGFEGLVGASLYLGSRATQTRAVVQIPGNAWRMPSHAFLRHLDDERTRSVFGAYTEALFSMAAQSAVCQAYHSVDKRLAKWLLMSHDRARSAVLPLTQEFLATMLGVYRPTITVTARLLQSAGLIEYRHGKIVILDPEALQDASCECYGTLRRLLPVT